MLTPKNNDNAFVLAKGADAVWVNTIRLRAGNRPKRQSFAPATLTSDPSLPQMYHKHSPHFTVETNNAQQLVVTAAGNIEKLLAKRSQALEVSLPSHNTTKPLFFSVFCQS